MQLTENQADAATNNGDHQLTAEDVAILHWALRPDDLRGPMTPSSSSETIVADAAAAANVNLANGAEPLTEDQIKIKHLEQQLAASKAQAKRFKTQTGMFWFKYNQIRRDMAEAEADITALKARLNRSENENVILQDNAAALEAKLHHLANIELDLRTQLWEQLPEQPRGENN